MTDLILTFIDQNVAAQTHEPETLLTSGIPELESPDTQNRAMEVKRSADLKFDSLLA